MPRTSSETRPARIASLDQFRGFTVLAMFLVNFADDMNAIPRVFQHNENWFSLADWIMPAFLFAVGISFRLTWQKRVGSLGRRAAIGGYVRRSFVLIAVSLVIYGFGADLSSWQQWGDGGMRTFVAALLKARLWEVLAIIGACQLVVLPFIGASTRIRVATACGLLVIHAALSQLFNVHFVLAQPNVLDAIWGAADVRAWDGGFFGLLSWSAIVLAGTVAWDVLSAQQPRRAAQRFLVIGLAGLAIGYALSCLSTLYDVSEAGSPDTPHVAASPVLPTGGAMTLAEPPFSTIPPASDRQVNYWMMSKRIVTIPFVTFALGCTFCALAAFVLLCDVRTGAWASFRILGQNALAAYILHYLVQKALRPLFPDDSPLWLCLVGLALFVAVTLGLMRLLEKKELYLRL